MKVTLALLVVASVLALVVAEHPLDNILSEMQNPVSGASLDLQQPRYVRAGGVCADRVFRWPCPTYEYLPRFGIEFRHYNGPLGVVFATAFGPPGFLFEGADFTFRAVERYFNGSNRENRKFENTVPFQLVIEVISITEWAYSAFFFLPNGTTNPPAPLEAYVRVRTFTNGFNIAAEQFAPTPLFEEGPENAERVIFGAAYNLEGLLAALRVSYYPGLFIFNEYNIPFVRQNRRNEVSFEILPRTSDGSAAAESVYASALHSIPVNERYYLQHS